MKYYERALNPRLNQALETFPVVLVTGPRQAGKSTLLHHALSSYQYVTLDDPLVRKLAQEDPELFLSTHPTPLIIDEIQYAPSLLPYLKIRVDKHRKNYGQYVLTGSQTFQLMQGVAETLAGRVAIFQLFPFSWNEIENIPGKSGTYLDELQLAGQIVQGFYPEFFSNPALDWNLWCSSYIATYLERDVRSVKAVSDLQRFQTFLNLLATRVGALVNLSEIAKECGVSQPTAKQWLTILEATYVVFLLRPYHKHRMKRLVKSPKLYFVDTGLLCYLLGIDSAERFLKASERGSLFENMIVIDTLKSLAYSGIHRDLFFYRTHAGLEVDLLIERGSDLNAYEIKFTKTPNKKMTLPLQQFRRDHPQAKLTLLTLRHDLLPITEKISSVHWTECANEFER